MTTTFKTSKQVAKEMMRLANAYSVVYDCNLIANDMKYYADDIETYDKAMKEYGKFRFINTYYIRLMGVERSEDRVKDMGDKVVAVVMVDYDGKGEYCVSCQNR